MTFEPARVKQN